MLGPLLNPRISGPVVAVLLLVAAYHAGQWKARTDAAQRAAEARLEHSQDAEERRNEIDALDPDSRDGRFDGLW
jgi:hypothetical protein